MEDELVRVIAPIEDTPAARAGVLAGDLHRRDRRRGSARNDAADAVDRCAAGQYEIVLTILRDGADEPIKITIVRDIIRCGGALQRRGRCRLHQDQFLHRADDGRPETRHPGYPQEIGEDELVGFVLDLRLNPGGLLDQAVNVADAFLDRGEIVSTRGRDPRNVSRASIRGPAIWSTASRSSC
jgi:carboxyl-terminal processing protease